VQRLITECGVSPTKVAELVQELPPKHFADICSSSVSSSPFPSLSLPTLLLAKLRADSSAFGVLGVLSELTVVDWFFSKINFTRYPIHEGLFRAAYEALYASMPLVFEQVRSLPLVFIILATVRLFKLIPSYQCM
jgi:hypothetical protein